AREDPGRAGAAVVAGSSEQRRAAVSGQRDAEAKFAFPALPRPGQFFALLRPGRARAGEDPGGAGAAFVARAADQCRVAVGGERGAVAEFAGPGLTRSGDLFALLGPGAARAGEDPGRARGGGVAGRADQRGGPTFRKCDAG